MRNVLDRRCRENQNTYCIPPKFFFEHKCRLWDHVEINTKWIVAFPLQQWLEECATMLRYAFNAYVVSFVYK